MMSSRYWRRISSPKDRTFYGAVITEKGWGTSKSMVEIKGHALIVSSLYYIAKLHHCFNACFKFSTNVHTSVKVLYNGAGATRTTPGSRLSHTTPISCSLCETCCSNPGFSNKHNWAPLASGLDGVMIWNCRDSSVLSFNKRCSRYAVIMMDFLRISAMDVLSNTESAAHRDVRSIAEGFEIWKPPAPGMGLNSVGSVSTHRSERYGYQTYCYPS